MTEVLELLGQLDHLGDVLGRAREDVRRQDVHERLVGVEGGLVGVGDLGRRLVLEAGLDEHPVLAAVEASSRRWPDVGDVLDVEHIDAVVQQHAPDEVGEEVGPQVADVGEAVHGRAAGVHPDAARLERLDGLDGSGEGVAETQWHGAIVRGPNGNLRSSLCHQRPRGSHIVPPAVWSCEASYHVRHAGCPGGRRAA